MSGTQGAPWGGKNGKSASQGATEVVGGMAVAARKSRTAQLQNLLDLGGRHASCQQSARDPQVHDAPIRLWESLCNLPAPHPGLVDLCGLGAGGVEGSSLRPSRRAGPIPEMRCVAGGEGLRTRGLQEVLGVAGQSGHKWAFGGRRQPTKSPDRLGGRFSSWVSR